MIKKIKLSVTNCYLISMGDKYLLIDTGYQKDKRKFYKQLDKYGIEIKDILYIFITHTHDDHVGLLNELIVKNPTSKVIMHQNAIKKLQTGKNDMSKSSYINKKVAATIGVFAKFSKGLFPTYAVREQDIIISEEITFNDLGIDIAGKIIETPGHTEDSISIILDEGVCICGDAAANMIPILGTKNCVIVVEDLKQYYATWEKILTEKGTKVFPAHGNAFGLDKIRKNLNKNQKKDMKQVNHKL